MSNVHKLNQLALWLPMNADELCIKKYGEGYPYEVNGEVKRATFDEPVIRYAKNYQTGEIRFSLCLITLDQEMSDVEAWLDKQAKLISSQDLDGKFKKLEKYYGL